MGECDVQVRGDGIVGRCLALALARAGLRVELQTEESGAARGEPDLPRAGARDVSTALVPASVRPVAREDVRAYALNAVSVELLRSLKVWDALPPDAVTPVHDMHVQGDRAGASIDFSSWRQQVGALAWIVDAAVLERELAAAVRFAPHVTTGSAALTAPLTAYCDGRDSSGRERLGVAFERIDYGQRAVAARLVVDRPHRGVARQWFRSPEVLALLPFGMPAPQRSYALVWSVPEARARELAALEAPAFEAELASATNGEAGALRLASPRADWPLARAAASACSGPGWVLLGDAAHLVHPLAGQGLNLGLGDVVALVSVLSDREPWRPLGDPRLLRRYARARAAPTWAMLQATDTLWRLFAEPAPVLAELRNRGLGWVDGVAPLKRWLTARALGV